MRRQIKRPISPETLQLLQRIQHHSKHPRVRRRAKFLILYHHGKSILYLINLFSVTRQTCHNWLNAWDKKGVVGLYDQVGRGRKRTFTLEQEAQIYQWAEETGRSLDLILRQIQDKFGTQISKRTLQRILKRMESRWPCRCQLTVS